MRWMLLIPLLVGASTVVQGGLNAIVSSRWGLAATVVFNNAIILALSVLLWGLVLVAPHWFPAFFADKGSWSDVRWWWLVPALGGLVIVGGIPWAMDRLGALPVLIGIVAAQMIGGLLWDALVLGQPIQWMRVGGASLALAGVVLASWPTGE